MLGDGDEARKALNRIPRQWHFHPAVLEVRRIIFDQLGYHQEALACAVAMQRAAPDHPYAWRFQAASLYKLNRLEECLNVTIEAMQTRPMDDRTAFDLARWQCRLGRLTEAQCWLQRAFTLARNPADLKLLALRHPDLKPLWDSHQP